MNHDNNLGSHHTRWRLILGEGSEALGQLSGDDALRSATLGFLYDREEGGTAPGTRSGRRGAGSGPSALTVPEWINAVHQLFPRTTSEIIEDDALQRYGMTEMITNGELLSTLEPSTTLLKAILQSKHLMNEEVLAQAREVVRHVVKDLQNRLRSRVVRSFFGKRDPHRRSMHKVARNFDAKRTIRANLRNFSTGEKKIVISEPHFVARSRRESEKYQVIVVVDQSASMSESVIHAAVTASIFYGIGSLKTHLIVFDREVADLSNDVDDPVELLMRVQLGGGTDIAQAMQYAATLITNPKRSIVVLISDFCEGGDEKQLLRTVSGMVEGGCKVLALAALDSTGLAAYCEETAKRLANRGAHVAGMTPEQLADWVAAEVI